MVLRVLKKRSQQKPRHDDQESMPAHGEQVPYRLASYQNDAEGKRFKSSNVAYSFWSASKYIFILSLVLFWLPLFGPMIAGYVGGRRAGSPWKGVAAAIIPVVALYFLVTAFETGFFPSHVFGIAIAPSAIQTALGENSMLAPYVDFSSEYLGNFVNSLESASPYGINPYVLTVVFAYIGGIIAEQHRREIEFASGAVVSNTTVLVHDSGNKKHHQVEDVQPHPGVLAAIASHLHLPHHTDTTLSAGYTHRKHHRDQWANAVDMRYPDNSRSNTGRREDPRGDGVEVYGAEEQQMRNEPHWRHRRRGRPNNSAKPRFSYPQLEQDAERKSHWSTPPLIRPPKGPERFSISPDPRSIRRAQKMIDREWNGKHRYSSYANRDVQETEAVAAEPEPEVSVHHKREQHNNWDTI